MIQFRKILEWLNDHQVDFIIIGGVAASLHGSAHVTFDLDICYSRTPDNLKNLAAALISITATLRGAPANLPFKADAQTLQRGLNFTFETDLGNLDLLGEVAGAGTYKQLIQDADAGQIGNRTYHIISLPKLIDAKRVAGRTKDLLVLPELEAILETQQSATKRNQQSSDESE